MRLDEAWERAATDAGLAASSAIVLQATSRTGFGAMHYPPGFWAMPFDTTFAYEPRQREQLYELRDEPVIVVDRAASGTRLAALLRHEAEHVRQDSEYAGVADVAVRLAAALPVEAFYQAMPHEREADAASTAFIATLGCEIPTSEREGNDRFLYGAPWPPPNTDELPSRLLAFSLFYPDEFDLACRASQTMPAADPDELLDRLVPGAAHARSEVRNDFASTFARLVRPDLADVWSELPRWKRNAINDESRFALLREEDHVLEELRRVLAGA